MGVTVYSSNARDALAWEAHFREKEMCASRMGRLYPPPWIYKRIFEPAEDGGPMKWTLASCGKEMEVCWSLFLLIF
jgi:hypothetical protein